MGTHANPKRNGYMGNICAFCHYFEKEVPLHRRSVGGVEYDDRVKAQCLAETGTKTPLSSTAACRKFKLSNDADRYAK